MTTPALYKYLDVQGARLTLGNRAFKHAKPSSFNDTEDSTARSIFPEDDETALKQIEDGFTEVLLRHLDDAPTCINPELREKVALLQAAFKANPDAARIHQESQGEGSRLEVFDLDYVKKRHREFLDEINQYMQDYRVLCVSALQASENMWTRYAQSHQGIVLRILPNVKKDF